MSRNRGQTNPVEDSFYFVFRLGGRPEAKDLVCQIAARLVEECRFGLGRLVSRRFMTTARTRVPTIELAIEAGGNLAY